MILMNIKMMIRK